MKLIIFTIFDSKAEAYLPPFFLPQIGMATRTFGDCINDREHQFSHHPQDYTLMDIGEFDDRTAIAVIKPPQSLGNGLEFVVIPQHEMVLNSEIDKMPSNMGKMGLGSSPKEVKLNSEGE